MFMLLIISFWYIISSIFSVITVQYVLNILFPRIQGMKRKALKVSHEIWLVYNLSMIGLLYVTL